MLSLELCSQVEQTKRFALTANATSVEFELRELFPYTLYSMNAFIWIKKGKMENYRVQRSYLYTLSIISSTMSVKI